jgi:1-acyl-sn-glycerol-3-phosphate acyltransferase
VVNEPGPLTLRQIARGPCLFVSNHASYLDALLLTAILPPEITFVAKRELERSLLFGPLFRRLGCVFVERYDVHEAATAARVLRARLESRQSLLVFAEGTFHRDPGLLPFHMGAFSTAASTQTQVVAVAIRGTRAMLPDGALLPRPTPLEISFSQPMKPSDSSWHAAVELRRRARDCILNRIHEPDLEQSPTGER